MEDNLGLTGQSNVFGVPTNTKNDTETLFSKSMVKSPPIVPPSKIPIITAASEHFSVGQHEKQHQSTAGKNSDGFI